MRARAGTIEVGDRVLVRILARAGKQKLADSWERDPYVVLEQPNHDIPVFVVQLENGKGPDRRTLHHNHLLSVTTLPMLPQKEPPKVMPRRKKQQVIQEDKVSSAGSVSTKTDVTMKGVLYSVTDERDTPAVLPEDGTGTISEVTGMQISDNVVESSGSSGECFLPIVVIWGKSTLERIQKLTSLYQRVRFYYLQVWLTRVELMQI